MSTDAKARNAVLVILDGFGINPKTEFNAVAQARTPTLDGLFKNSAHTELDASESHVGLPNGFMGNSEVGHLNIGAGRVVYQDFSLISHAIEEGTFSTNPVFLTLFNAMKAAKGKPTLHLMGLLSDGGVHSHISHLLALVQLAVKNGITRVAVHAFMDGRDTSPTSGIDYITRLNAFLRDVGAGEVVTVMGRFYAMDRDNRWERTEAAYEAIVRGKADHSYADAADQVRTYYDERITDEFMPPSVKRGYAGVNDGDGVLFYNFRADRARQITRAFTQAEFPFFPRQQLPTLSGYVTMTPYDETFTAPYAYAKPKVENTIGEFVAKLGWKQLRIAETEKYAHVTYFFNGGEEKVFEGEKRVLVPSPREVRTYDLKPEMSAGQVTDQLLAELKTGQYTFTVVNYANCDMVGHTGNLRAAIAAVETVDQCLAKVLKAVEEQGGFLVLTADHGNCEMMQDSKGQPLTSHTLLPVPFVVFDPGRKNIHLSAGGRLCDIAPTIIELWGMKPPKEMTGKSLLTR
jgi:2,3-bisphosphoglycerate-independent phosphoglycerate mutase